MWGHDDDLLNSTEFAQPALFAVEVALYRLLESWGVRPDFVMGHSVGELTAAHVADVLSLENAAVLVVARGRFMQALPAGGAMMAVQATEDEVRPLLTDGVGIAAVNGPSSVVVSGDEDAVTAIADQLREQGRRVHKLAVSHAFHSPLMEPMIDEFKTAAKGLAVKAPIIPVISNVTGKLAEEDFASADYWTQHIRAAVRFADSIRFANSAGANRFLEVGPGGGLTSSIEESLAEADIVSVPMLRKDRPEPASLMTGLAQAFVSGLGVDWRAVLPGAGFVELPTYAFERRRFWLSSDGAASDAAGLGLAPSEHALLGAVVDLPGSGGGGADGPAFRGVAGLACRPRRRWRGGVPRRRVRRVGDPRRRRSRLLGPRRTDAGGAVGDPGDRLGSRAGSRRRRRRVRQPTGIGVLPQRRTLGLDFACRRCGPARHNRLGRPGHRTCRAGRRSARRRSTSTGFTTDWRTAGTGMARRFKG